MIYYYRISNKTGCPLPKCKYYPLKKLYMV